MGFPKAPQALAQFGMDDWPGTKPTKAVGGGDVSWNGVEWVVPPGGVIEWTIRITNDHFDPAVLVGIQDDIPDQNDGDPMLPFDPAVDVLRGELVHTGDRWQITGLSESVPEEGLHTFVTADISDLPQIGSRDRRDLGPTRPARLRQVRPASS